MAGFFGSHSNSVIPQRYNGIQISASSSGGCIPLLYGQQRLPFNLIWYGDFSSTPTNSSGGKGGGGQATGYNYKASFAAAICEGPVTAIPQVWNDKDLVNLTDLGFALFYGTSGQATWSYLTSNYPAQAIPYDHICYVVVEKYNLGSSASMPNFTFEVQMPSALGGTPITFTGALPGGATSATLNSATLANGTWNITFSSYEVRVCTVNGTSVSWTGGLTGGYADAITAAATAGNHLDADPSFIIIDYLTNTEHGAGFPASKIGNLTGSNSYQSYCLALGLSLSPLETTQRAASDFVKEILQITNSDAVWSAGTLNVYPYADAAVSGNGYTYTPNLTPEYLLADDDFTEPPELTRKAVADTYNHVRIEYLDRSNEYNANIAEATDLGDIALTGERVMNTLSFHEITNSATAGVSAQLILQTNLYERNTIKVKVRSDYCLLEPMDYVGITDANLGYVDQVFRITKVTDDDKDELELEMMEVPGTVRTSAVYNWGSVAGFVANQGASPGSVFPPAFFEAYGSLVGPAGGRELWIGVQGPDDGTNWGGCYVYMSFDNTTYQQIATVTAPARYGTLSAALPAGSDPDTTNTLTVTLFNQLASLESGTQADADQDRLLIAVNPGTATCEVMAYETATLVTAGEYNLTYLRRGQYQTTSQSHVNGSNFLRLDNTLVKIELDPGYLGTTIYFKFTSFNTYVRALEDISAVTAYSYVPGQAQVAYNPISTSTFIASGQVAMLSPTSAFKYTTAAIAWDSSVYSAQSYSNGCTAECYAGTSSSPGPGANFMLGLTVNPTASNSYTNLAYAFYFISGALQIYEGGSFVGYFPNYSNTTQCVIGYDGKNVTYYVAGSPVRSVNMPNQTFYMQVCFCAAGASVYGLLFDNQLPATQNYTLLSLSQYVAVAGTAVTASSGGPNSWGYRNFQSKESYANGVALSASMNPIQGTVVIGFGETPGLGNTPPTSYSAAWYLDPTTNQCEIICANTTLVTGLATPATTDVFSIEYDTFYFYFFRNANLVYQYYLPHLTALFLEGDFYYPSTGLVNVTFSINGEITPNPFLATNGCVTHDSTAQKVAGSNTAWDSAVYSINQYNQCHVQCKPSNTSYQFMIGLSAQNPVQAGTSSYTNLNYAIFMAGGAYACYESGTNVAWSTSPPAPSVTDLLAITYDDTNINYYINGILLRQVAASGNWYANSSFLNLAAAINSLSFGPGPTLDQVPTALLDNNAATTVGAVTFSGVTVANSSVGSYTNIATLTLGPFSTVATIVLSVSGQWASLGSAAGAANWLFSTVSGTSGSNIGQCQSSYPASAGYSGTMSLEITVSLAANTSQQYWLNGIGLGALGGGFTTTGTFKVEAIKR